MCADLNKITILESINDSIKKISGSTVLISGEASAFDTLYFGLDSDTHNNFYTDNKNNPVMLARDAYDSMKDISGEYIRGNIISSAVRFNRMFEILTNNYSHSLENFNHLITLNDKQKVKQAKNDIISIVEEIKQFLTAERLKLELVKPQLNQSKEKIIKSIEASKTFYTSHPAVLQRINNEDKKIESQERELSYVGTKLGLAIGIALVAAAVGITFIFPVCGIALLAAGMKTATAVACVGFGVAAGSGIVSLNYMAEYMHKEKILQNDKTNLAKYKSDIGTLVSYRSEVSRFEQYVQALSENMIEARKNIETMNTILLSELDRLSVNSLSKDISNRTNDDLLFFIDKIKESSIATSNINMNLKAIKNHSPTVLYF